jgi:hypothetical protein
MGTSTTVNTATHAGAQRSVTTARTAGDSRRHNAGNEPSGASGNTANKSERATVNHSANTRGDTNADTTRR